MRKCGEARRTTAGTEKEGKKTAFNVLQTNLHQFKLVL